MRDPTDPSEFLSWSVLLGWIWLKGSDYLFENFSIDLKLIT